MLDRLIDIIILVLFGVGAVYIIGKTQIQKPEWYDRLIEEAEENVIDGSYNSFLRYEHGQIETDKIFSGGQLDISPLLPGNDLWTPDFYGY